MEINIDLSKKQWIAINHLYWNQYTQIGYWWAAWWWKSYLWVFWIWSMCMKYPNTRWFFWRKELTNLRRTTLNSYFKFCADYKIPEDDRWILNWKDNVIRFTNWSEILLLDLAYKPSDPLYTRFWSLELTGWFIDESNEIDYECLDILNTRLWRQMNKEHWIKPKLLETFNPDKWHIYNRYFKPYKTGTLPEYRIFIPALVTDNKYIDENYIEQLKKADTITQQRLLYWNFDYDDTAGKLFRYDEILDMFSNNIAESNTKYITADIARLGDDKTVIWLREWRYLKRIYIYEKLTTDQTAIKIKELERTEGVQRSHIVVDSDWLWAWVADQLRWCYNFINNSRPIDARTEQNFSNLKTQCYYYLRLMWEKREIRIEASWSIRDNIEQELDNVLIKDPDKDTKIRLEGKDELKRKIWRSPDTADMIMMRSVLDLLGMKWNSTPIPQWQQQSFNDYLWL